MEFSSPTTVLKRIWESVPNDSKSPVQPPNRFSKHHPSKWLPTSLRGPAATSLFTEEDTSAAGEVVNRAGCGKIQDEQRRHSAFVGSNAFSAEAKTYSHLRTRISDRIESRGYACSSL